jgi:hypothetical protein
LAHKIIMPAKSNTFFIILNLNSIKTRLFNNDKGAD